jgi:hypothetical protein
MKKIILLVLSVFIISLTFLGCSKQTVQLELSDKVSGLGILQVKTCAVDGKEAPIVDGKISLSAGQHTIGVNGYYDVNINIEKDAKGTKISLTPKAYLIITTNATQETITIDGVKPQYTTGGDSAFVTSLEKAEEIKTHDITISPVAEDIHLLKISSPYFEDFSKTIEIKEGKNADETLLKPDEKKIKDLVNSITFPEDMKDFDFAITLQGTLNGQAINDKNINGKVSGSAISEISDENITYTFLNGKPYIDNQEVKDKEKLQALLFASNTLKEFINIKGLIANFALLTNGENATVYVNETNGNGLILLEGYKLFEERNVYEHFVVNFQEKSVNTISLEINSDALKTNLNTDIQITRR